VLFLVVIFPSPPELYVMLTFSCFLVRRTIRLWGRQMQEISLFPRLENNLTNKSKYFQIVFLLTSFSQVNLFTFFSWKILFSEHCFCTKREICTLTSYLTFSSLLQVVYDLSGFHVFNIIFSPNSTFGEWLHNLLYILWLWFLYIKVIS
jgi:hypothetical protein